MQPVSDLFHSAYMGPARVSGWRAVRFRSAHDQARKMFFGSPMYAKSRCKRRLVPHKLFLLESRVGRFLAAQVAVRTLIERGTGTLGCCLASNGP
jgi:hypothetical protein